jgi:hypothetical protein
MHLDIVADRDPDTKSIMLCYIARSNQTSIRLHSPIRTIDIMDNTLILSSYLLWLADLPKRWDAVACITFCFGFTLWREQGPHGRPPFSFTYCLRAFSASCYSSFGVWLLLGVNESSNLLLFWERGRAPWGKRSFIINGWSLRTSISTKPFCGGQLNNSTCSGLPLSTVVFAIAGDYHNPVS